MGNGAEICLNQMCFNWFAEARQVSSADAVSKDLQDRDGVADAGEVNRDAQPGVEDVPLFLCGIILAQSGANNTRGAFTRTTSAGPPPGLQRRPAIKPRQGEMESNTGWAALPDKGKCHPCHGCRHCV
eukprot:3341028-Ditylum_brightwellii.AAC.1